MARPVELSLSELPKTSICDASMKMNSIKKECCMFSNSSRNVKLHISSKNMIGVKYSDAPCLNLLIFPTKIV